MCPPPGYNWIWVVIFTPDDQGQFPSVCVPQQSGTTTTTATTTISTTTSIPVSIPPHHHHHDFWSIPGQYPSYDYGFSSFSYDPFFSFPFLPDPFFYEAHLGWFRSHGLPGHGLQDRASQLARSQSLEELVRASNMKTRQGGKRRTRQGKKKKTRQEDRKIRRVQQKSRKSRKKITGNKKSAKVRRIKNKDKKLKLKAAKDNAKQVTRKETKTKSALQNNPLKTQRHIKPNIASWGESLKRGRRSSVLGSLNWEDIQAWRGRWPGTNTSQYIHITTDKKKIKKVNNRNGKGKGKYQKRKENMPLESRSIPQKRRTKSTKSTQSTKRSKVDNFLKAVVGKYGAKISMNKTSSPGKKNKLRRRLRRFSKGDVQEMLNLSKKQLHLFGGQARLSFIQTKEGPLLQEPWSCQVALVCTAWSPRQGGQRASPLQVF